MTITYAMTSALLFIGLTMMLVDVCRKLRGNEHRMISLILIGTTMFYVAMDYLWITAYTAEVYNRRLFVLLNFLFYLVYITLPFVWFLFSRHFAGGKLTGRRWNILFALPWCFNLALVLLTVLGADLLWRIGDSASRYARGPLFGIFSGLNLVYYFIPVAGILALLVLKSGSDRKNLLTTLGFSMIPALGVFIHTYWIPVEAIYPFQPCCFFIGVMFAYILILTQVYKKAEDENLRLIEEAKAADRLADLMGSVGALLTNMPAMTFSKELRTGRYLACNQSFAEYAHKKTPDGVVGLTDHEIFDPVTADHFVEDDQKAAAMDEPYVFFEDVPDAAGKVIRNLQTTKLTFKDGAGRLCLLGMCVDVTEMTKIKQAETEGRIKQQELEERLALQEELLRRQGQAEQQQKLITALCSDYRSVYYLELDTDDGICYQSRTDLPGYQVGERFKYLESFTAYCNQYVLEAYRADFMRMIQPDAVREGLKNSLVYTHRYMICVDGRESYEEVRFAGVRHPEDRADHLVHSVGACFIDVDAETRKMMQQSKELQEALEEAEAANRAKTTFLSNMSHEIRTPMNAIIGLDSIALSDPAITETTRDHLEKIGTSAHHLLGIINDILDMSRIESGRMTIKLEEFSFSKTLEQVNTIISGQCRDKGLQYECRTKGQIDEYYIGDDMKLRQVMINILGNAVKFTPEGGTVTFDIEDVARWDDKAALRFTISDTGIGMSREYLPKLFDAFSQEDSSSTNRYGSTGLGMPITKSIVELMNGEISVESEKGVGTTFTVTITFGQVDHKTIDTGTEIRPNEMNVLVVDDDRIACEHAQLILGQVGISCEMVMSGKEAVEMVKMRHARREDYNLILVDWKMPEMDGLETTRQIRAIVGHETPIIILTSYSWEDIVEEAMGAGVDTFAAKPLFAGTLMDEFREAFRKKNKRLARETADLKGKRVLLAEDVTVNAEIMMMVLSMREMEVDHAENGRIAVKLFADHEEGFYDAILMDMRMPEMDGLEATAAIRTMNRKDAKTVPIIALTANAFDEDVQRSMQAGLNAHLSKPVEPEVLFETLEELIGARK